MKAMLQKKIAGYPLWVWLVILLVAVAVGLYWRARNAEAEEEPTDEDLDEGYADPVEFYDDGSGEGLFGESTQGANEMIGVNFTIQRLIEAMTRNTETLANWPPASPPQPKPPSRRPPWNRGPAKVSPADKRRRKQYQTRNRPWNKGGWRISAADRKRRRKRRAKAKK